MHGVNSTVIPEILEHYVIGQKVDSRYGICSGTKKMHGVNEVELQLKETHSLSELHTLCTGLT